MRLGIKRIVFAMLVLSVFISGDLCAANGTNPVRVDGDRLSVHAEGMSLGELLTVVEDMTGVQFTFDELVATKKIFLDFKGLPLSEGIKKIIYPLSSAAVYDDTGKLRRVIILERWKGSGMGMPREEASDSPGGPKPGPSDSISFTPKRGSDSPGGSNSPPPVYKAYSGSRSTNAQNKIPEGLPVPAVRSSDHLPDPDSKGAVMESSPVDTVDSGGGPPDSQDEIPEILPIPGVASSDHLPTPGP